MTTTPAIPELSRGEIIDLISPLSKNSADHDIEFANRVIDALATLQSQPAEVSDAELRKTIDALRDPGTVSAFYNGYYTLTPDELRRAILALRPQAESDEPTDEQIAAGMRELFAGPKPWPYWETTLKRVYQAVSALRPQAAPVGFDVEAMIRAVLPGGDYCDPQAVADAIRDYVAASPQAVPMTDEQRQRVFAAAEHRTLAFDNVSWRDAIVDEVEAHHGITAPAGGEGKA